MQFKEALDIYNRQLLKIIFVTIVIFMPVHLFTLAWNVYLQQALELDFLYYYISFSYIFLMIIVMPPYIAITINDVKEDDSSYRKLFKVFIDQFGFLLFSTVLLFLIALFGLFLLYIPTMIALALIALLPLHVNEKNSIKQTYRNVWIGFKNRILDLVIFMIFAISVNALIWYGLVTGISYFETNLLTYMILRVMINLIILPYLFILFTLSFHPDNTKQGKWLSY